MRARTPCYSWHPRAAAACVYAIVAAVCGLRSTLASHIHSWLPLAVPKTLVVSVPWLVNIITGMTVVCH